MNNFEFKTQNNFNLFHNNNNNNNNINNNYSVTDRLLNYKIKDIKKEYFNLNNKL